MLLVRWNVSFAHYKWFKTPFITYMANPLFALSVEVALQNSTAMHGSPIWKAESDSCEGERQGNSLQNNLGL